MKHSKKHQLNAYDLVKGLFIAFLTASLTGLIDVLNAGGLPSIEAVRHHCVVGLSAAAAYILKQFLTNSEGVVLKKERTESFKDRV